MQNTSTVLNRLKVWKNKISVLLIHGWKNSAANTKTVVAMIYFANERKAFVEAWDLTNTSETGQKLARIGKESITISKEKYEVNLYAVVSDNATNMLKMGQTISIWHSTCSSHSTNLLAKDLVDSKLQK